MHEAFTGELKAELKRRSLSRGGAEAAAAAAAACAELDSEEEEVNTPAMPSGRKLTPLDERGETPFRDKLSQGSAADGRPRSRAECTPRGDLFGELP